MRLHCESFGAGPDVVLLHGWGWHGGVWDDVARALARDFRVWVPDLPGHGRSREAITTFTLDSLAQAVSTCVPRAAAWMGWSLGGLVTVTAAQRGDVQRMVLVGTTPRFVEDTDWHCGLSRQWFSEFTEEVARDATHALERFASLHLTGDGNERPLLRRLRTALSQHAVPDLSALQTGLCVLETSDLRSQLSALRVPALVVHGASDRIVSCDAGKRLAQALPQARFESVVGAGHALFLSHQDLFMNSIGAFLREQV